MEHLKTTTTSFTLIPVYVLSVLLGGLIFDGIFCGSLFADACMHSHNFIVDFCKEFESGSTGVDLVERSLFNKDCRRFLAEQSGDGPVGVYGGEQNALCNANGNEYNDSRRLTNIESETTAEGRSIRERVSNYYIKSEDLSTTSVIGYFKDNKLVGCLLNAIHVDLMSDLLFHFDLIDHGFVCFGGGIPVTQM